MGGQLQKVNGPAFRRLYAIQFFAWSAMFVLWVSALPLIAARVVRVSMGDALSMHRAVVATSLSFAGYATLAACCAFLWPAIVRHIGNTGSLALGLAAGASGFLLLSLAQSTLFLVIAFAFIAIGWSALSTHPYALLAETAPPDRLALVYRLFGFSIVVPQLFTTFALIEASAMFSEQRLPQLMQAASASMLMAALLAWRMHRDLAR